jgi:DNA-binding PadR family transcriptional regulator
VREPIKKNRLALTTADVVVLSLLAERPMHGYQLHAEMERQEVSDWANVSRPHVYYALTKLARTGLIVKTRDPAAASGPERTRYAVTAKGKTEMEAALSEAHWATQRPPSPFTTWLGLSLHAPKPAVHRLIAARIRFVEEQLAKEQATLPHVQADPSPRARLGEHLVTLCIRQFETELTWLRSLMSERKT